MKTKETIKKFGEEYIYIKDLDGSWGNALFYSDEIPFLIDLLNKKGIVAKRPKKRFWLCFSVPTRRIIVPYKDMKKAQKIIIEEFSIHPRKIQKKIIEEWEK